MGVTEVAVRSCVCGHTAHWHGDDGAGRCEHDGQCGCRRFISSEHTPEQRAWLDGMRSLIEFCERHPNLTPRWSESEGYREMVFAMGPEDWEALCAELGISAGHREDDELYVRHVRCFGPHKLQVYAVAESVR